MRIYRIFPEAQAIGIADTLKEKNWVQGKARTSEETGTTKQNGEILEHPLLESLGKRILNHPDIAIDVIPLKCHKPKFSRYRDGERYHRHTDAPWMGTTRTDLSCTLFLSDPDSYDGGELVVDGEVVKCKAGEAVIYDCGAIHEVSPVTSGERICAVTWIQSRVRDQGKRNLISEYRRFVEKLKGQPEMYLEAGRFNSALLRMWSE